MVDATDIISIFEPLITTKRATLDNTPEREAACQALQKANYENMIIMPLYVNSFIAVHNSAKIYVPDTAFDYYDSCYDFHLWQMLA